MWILSLNYRVSCVFVFFKESASVLKIHLLQIGTTYVITVVCFSIVQISARIFRVSLIPANTLRKFNFFGWIFNQNQVFQRVL